MPPKAQSDPVGKASSDRFRFESLSTSRDRIGSTGAFPNAVEQVAVGSRSSDRDNHWHHGRMGVDRLRLARRQSHQDRARYPRDWIFRDGELEEPKVGDHGAGTIFASEPICCPMSAKSAAAFCTWLAQICERVFDEGCLRLAGHHCG